MEQEFNKSIQIFELANKIVDLAEEIADVVDHAKKLDKENNMENNNE